MIIFELFVTILIGLIAGSFSTALIHRVPQKLDWISQRSACPRCGHKLGALDLFPVFSWLFSGGKCRHCKEPVSARYPLTELACAGLCLGIYAAFGFNIPSILCMAAVPFLVSLAVIDLQHMILPNALVMALFILGAMRLAFWYVSGQDVTQYILGGVIFAFLSWLIGFGMEKILRKEALGFGDVKFFMIAGLWLGLGALPYFLMGSGILGVLLALVWQQIKKTSLFPFGPALIATFYILLLYQGVIMV